MLMGLMGRFVWGLVAGCVTSRFVNGRGGDEFADKMLPTLRYQLSDHEEKAAAERGGS